MLTELSLKDKVAIVTGSTKGIGRGIAEGMALSGANLVVVSRNQAECDDVAVQLSAHGGKVLGIRTDVTKIAEVENLVQQTVSRLGRIDIFVNNAGSAITKKAEDLTEADWDQIINIDLKAVFFRAQTAGREMLKHHRGKIINISSILGLVG